MWAEASIRQTLKKEVNTYHQGDEVNLTATFKTIGRGLTRREYDPGYADCAVFAIAPGLPVDIHH